MYHIERYYWVGRDHREDGWNVLVGANRGGRILEMIKGFEPDREQRNVFGDGKASKRIVEISFALYHSVVRMGGPS